VERLSIARTPIPRWLLVYKKEGPASPIKAEYPEGWTLESVTAEVNKFGHVAWFEVYELTRVCRQERLFREAL